MAGLKPTAADVVLGTRITGARRAAGLTQRALAEPLGISAPQLQKYEKGTNRLSATSLPIIARLTGRSVAWLLGEPEATVSEEGAARTALAEIQALIREHGFAAAHPSSTRSAA